MSSLSTTSSPAASKPSRYGWVIVVLAAFIMLSTLPGRTQGLGLITEPLLKDSRVDRVQFANINLWATLLGAAFCLPIGSVIDRFGIRLVSFAMLVATGLSAWLLSRQSSTFWSLFFTITLMRGFGQSALSVCSITAVGKWFSSRSGPAMGAFASLMLFLMAIAFGIVGKAILDYGWRTAWAGVGLFLIFGVAPLALIFLKNPTQNQTLREEDETTSSNILPAGQVRDFSLQEALRTPAFWIFAGATALFGLASSGLGLFQQSVLEERGFDENTYHIFLMVTTLLSLFAQLVAGWLSLRFSIGAVTGVAMLFYAAALGMLPGVSTSNGLWCFAALMGIAAGMIVVVFFAVWGQFFGRAHLGRIQAAAQMVTVFASAIGPLLFAECHARFHSYSPVLLLLAPIVLLFGLSAWLVKPPALLSSRDFLLKGA